MALTRVDQYLLDTEISAEITANAVDVFIYDTSKDSDGGAWRKRTAHTSWYNETLNTATRGARREFPSVAVIVVENSKVTIYDGDNPDLPMWMVFNQGGSNFIYDNLTSGYALNGVLSLTNKDSPTGNWIRGLRTLNFISEVGFAYDANTNTSVDPIQYDKKGYYNGLIIDRNASKAFDTTDINIIHHRVNDVAMTVLPNAPIDPSTGLPTPTIAVATDGGVSVIRDDGTVISSTTNVGYPIKEISIFSSGELYHRQGSGSNEGICFNYPYTRISGIDLGIYANSSSFWYASQGIGNLSNYLGNSQIAPNAITTPSQSSLNIGDNRGLTFVDVNKGSDVASHSSLSTYSLNNGMVAYATTSYNTGWMHGDIKGAFLSDTDDTNITGSELVTNGTFDTNSDWTYQNNSSGWTISGGTLNYNGTGTLYYKAYQNITGLVVGETYVLSIDVISLSSSSISFAFATSNIGSNLFAKTVTTTGTHSITWIADRSDISVYVQTNLATQTYSVDNVSLRIADPDRSGNNNGLQVFGTITKSPVATGAELVSYGFSASSSNYLLQPYNSDLNFGTGDFSIMYWYYQNTSPTNYQDVVSRTSSPLSDGSWTIQHFPSDAVYAYFRVSGSWSSLGNSGSNITHNGWNFIVVTRNGSTSKMYFDGREVSSVTQSATMTNTSAQLKINTRLDNTLYPLENGNGVALVRLSASAPSPEQIKKIYEDEKVLFQENAACTLYGSSDAITALTYDEVTERLHVGTSSGRSDFQGLRRISNTTTPVTTALSAHDGFIVEQ